MIHHLRRVANYRRNSAEETKIHRQLLVEKFTVPSESKNETSTIARLMVNIQGVPTFSDVTLPTDSRRKKNVVQTYVQKFFVKKLQRKFEIRVYPR